jgi:peptidyl-prolyl cis-trans isomerase D
MFIAHGERVRKYMPWILAGVLVLMLPGFLIMFGPSGSVKQQRSQLPMLGGKPVNFAEFQAARNAVMTDIILSSGHRPPGTLQVEDEINIRAIQRLVLLRKAREFGLRASDEEVVREIRAQPPLLNERKQFDPDRYQRYVIYLNNLGVSEAQFEDTMRGEILVSQLRALIATAAKVTPTALQLAYVPLREQAIIDYVEFNATDRKEPFNVKDDEAKAFYEQNREKFRKPALVKVRYVYFTVPDAKKSVTLADDEIAEYYDRNKDEYLDAEKKPKPLADVKDAVKKDLLDLRADRLAGDRATGLSVKLVHEPGMARPDFAKVAAESGLTPKETEFFDSRSAVSGVDAGQQFNLAAFSLSPEVPFSDPVHGTNGYYVLEYAASKPSEIPTLEEVKDQVVDRLKRQLAFGATVKQGQELDAKVKAALTAGKSFTDACAALGLKVKTTEPFAHDQDTASLPFESQVKERVKEMVIGMATNSISDFVVTAQGGLFFHLKQRLPPKSEDSEKEKKQLEAALLARNREALFQDWANSAILAERIEYKPKALPVEQTPPAEETEPAGQPVPPS